MEIAREKILVCSVVVAVITGVLIGSQLSAPILYSVSDGFKLQGYWTVEIKRADGSLVLYQQMHNLVTDIGKTKARDYFSLGSTDITKYLALSNDATPLATWTKLPNELDNTKGLGRATGAVTTVNSTAYKTEYTWTASGTETVQCTGVHWVATMLSDNNLYAAGTFTQTTLNDQDTIKITYTLNYG